jgi:hypothetical protein
MPAAGVEYPGITGQHKAGIDERPVRMRLWAPKGGFITTVSHAPIPASAPVCYISGDERDGCFEFCCVSAGNSQGMTISLYPCNYCGPEKGGTDGKNPCPASQVADVPVSDISPERGMVKEPGR